MLKDVFLGRFRKLCENFLDIVEKKMNYHIILGNDIGSYQVKRGGLKSTLGKIVEDRTFS